MATKSQWTTISLTPLTGMLDVRSRPADLAPGAFRDKLNMQATPEGKMCRRGGFDKAFGDVSGYTNFDHHKQGAERELITFGFEATSSDGNRYLYDGTESRISVLNETTGFWTDIASGLGDAGSVWRAAMLQDKIVFTNNVDEPRIHTLASGTSGTIPELAARGVTAALVVFQFNGIMVLANVVQGGQRHGYRLVWSDLNDATKWAITVDPDNLAGYQDLDYGDDILAAAPLGGAFYIYTRRSIWRMTVAGTTDHTFSFTRVYNEPKNQEGCLAFPYTLVSDGASHYYMSRTAIYRFNPYLPAPEYKIDESDWLHRASGLIYKKATTAMNQTNCFSPVADYRPATKELWFSWPTQEGNHTWNNISMVAQLDKQTADRVDHGFSCFLNYRRTPGTADQCNEVQSFLAVSTTDWCWKDIGAAFRRELAVLAGELTDDLDDIASYRIVGYNSLLCGMIPTGLYDREKILRCVLLDDDVSEQPPPACKYRLRIGNSFALQDPTDTDDICAVMWDDEGTIDVRCTDARISELKANHLKPAVTKQWKVFRQNRFLYWELTIEGGTRTVEGPNNVVTSLAIGGDTCLNRVDFDVMALAKP